MRAFAEGILHIAREVGGRREIQLVRNLRDGQFLVPEQARNLDVRKAVDPVVCRKAACLLADFGKVFVCNAEFLRVVRKFAVLAECAAFKHSQELRDDCRHLCRNLVFAKFRNLEVEEIQEQLLQCADKRFAEELVPGKRKTVLHVLEVMLAALLRFLAEFDNRVREQKERTLDAVVALRLARADKVVVHVNRLDRHVRRFRDVRNQLGESHDHAVARDKRKRIFVELELATSAVAKDMRHEIVEPPLGKPRKVSLDDDLALDFG